MPQAPPYRRRDKERDRGLEAWQCAWRTGVPTVVFEMSLTRRLRPGPIPGGEGTTPISALEPTPSRFLPPGQGTISRHCLHTLS